ncbi:ComEA family DNA-binding protein [Parvibium lacunae]|uniref:ComEA family DNA-binding protein n=1 Tax=Parvibium lacunae TaxID=1888893 RepID=UPI0013149546|nr:helix-hairpin-helix domain-containing protein [Parvibium lacunae]
MRASTRMSMRLARCRKPCKDGRGAVWLALALSLSAQVSAQTVSAPVSTSVVMRVNVNTADQGQLEVIRQIGPALAARIIANRTAQGPFDSIEALAQRVKGIGPKTRQQLEAAGLCVACETIIPLQPLP